MLAEIVADMDTAAALSAGSVHEAAMADLNVTDQRFHVPKIPLWLLLQPSYHCLEETSTE